MVPVCVVPFLAIGVLPVKVILADTLFPSVSFPLVNIRLPLIEALGGSEDENVTPSELAISRLVGPLLLGNS